MTGVVCGEWPGAGGSRNDRTHCSPSYSYTDIDVSNIMHMTGHDLDIIYIYIYDLI